VRLGETRQEVLMAKGVGVPPWADGNEPCHGLTHIFFPDRRNRPRAAAQIELARSLCAVCDKRLACLVEADNRGETDGVWGGVDFFTPSHWRKATPPCGTADGAAVHEAAGTDVCLACRRAHSRAARARTGG
jgi:hypothetical protein